MSAVVERRPGRQDEFTGERHVYEPHRIGLPPLRSYFREVWRRRHFAYALARTDLRGQYFNTAFGQLWLILNPLFLAMVFFLLIEIVGRGEPGGQFFAHLMEALFAFRFVSMSVRDGAGSVVGGGRLILNTAFPRMLLPISSVLGAFMRFVPTLAVYAVAHLVVGLPLGLHLFWVLPIFAMMALFALGAAMLVAAAQVYFRDLRHFMRYLLRIWLYLSPILFYVHQVPESVKPIVAANPLYPMLGSLSDVVNEGGTPEPLWLGWSLAWATVVAVVGILFFISREREFAVRL